MPLATERSEGSAHAGLKVGATQTEGPKRESGGGTSKSPEQSENVIENKALKAEAVDA
jgi:NOL1/NOP2/fmu family ribosome biogenesis protein